MNKNFKTLSVLLATVILGTSLSACTSNNNTSDSTTPANGESTAKTEGTPNGEVVTVDFWTAPQIVQYNFWEQKANAFNATNTMANGKVVQVKVQQMPETPSSEAGIQNALATGTVPAISENINRGFAATLANSGVIYDLQEQDWFKDVIQARAMEDAIEGWSIDGKQYVLPVYVNPMTWQWNMKALNTLGFTEAPSTVTEFDSIIKAFADNKDKMKEIGVSHSFYRPSLTRADQWWDRWQDFQMPYEALSGGKPWVEGNKLVLDREASIEAFELLGKFGNTLQTGEMSSIWIEENPSVLVTINAPWEIEIMRENKKVYGQDYIYGPSIVKNEGEKPYNYADAKGLVLYKNNSISEDEHNGAVEFVKWVYNKENSAQTDLDWLKATTMLPVRGDLTENETFKEILTQYPELKALAEYVPYAIPCMPHDKMTDIQTALTEKGMAPYIEEVRKSEPLNPPDASKFVDAAFEAMKKAGGLE